MLLSKVYKDTSALKVIIIREPPTSQKSFLKIEYDTWTLLAGFIVPITSFLLGFWVSILRERYKKIETLRGNSAAFSNWVKRSLKSAKILEKEIYTKGLEAANLPNFNFSKPSYINLHLGRVSLFDQNIIYQSFVTQRIGDYNIKISDYSKLIIDLDFLKELQERIYQNIDIAIDEFKELFEEWNEFITNFHKAKHALIGKRSNQITPDNYLGNVNLLFNEWYDQENPTMDYTYNFLKSVELVLAPFYRDNPADDDVATLLSLSQQIQVRYKRFLFYRERYSKILINYSKQFEETIKEIEKLLSTIEARKMKNFFQ